LQIGVDKRIREAMPDIDQGELSAFLRHWVSRSSYQRAVFLLRPRIALDGTIAGYPDAGHQKAAALKLCGGNKAKAAAMIERLVREPGTEGA
jgi:sRNA-binding protein